MKKVEVLGIDLVRFLAATSVVCWHFAGKPFLDPAGSTITPLMPASGPMVPAGVDFSWFGWVGVQIFFVISGVVIAYSAERASGKSFFIGRVARLWPAMFVSATLCSILSVVFWHTAIPRQILKYVGSLIFAPFGPWFSGQVWTLPVEIMFYAAVWALVATRRIRWLEPMAWILACASLTYWIGSTATGHAVPGKKYLTLLLIPHGCYFATGIVLAKISSVSLTPSRSVLLLVGVAAALIEITTRASAEMAGAPYRYDALVPCIVWIGGIGAIWASMAWRHEIAGRLDGHHAFFKLLGALTYPLYLVHYQTGGPVFAALYARGVPIWLAFIPAFLVALACAYLIAQVAEPILSGWIKTRLQQVLNVPGRDGRRVSTPAASGASVPQG